MLLLIDNYDSFTYNLLHYLCELGAEVIVHRNDSLTVDEALAFNPQGLVLSPGPVTLTRLEFALSCWQKHQKHCPFLVFV